MQFNCFQKTSSKENTSLTIPSWSLSCCTGCRELFNTNSSRI